MIDTMAGGVLTPVGVLFIGGALIIPLSGQAACGLLLHLTRCRVKTMRQKKKAVQK
jgi:hypothetical protein